MQIDGISVTRFSDFDGLPIKNHLPESLRERMKTENQWLESGYFLKPGATKYEMHPSVLSKRLCSYYLDTDVEKPDPANVPKNCMTCRIRDGRYCCVAGDYISAKHCCSEWDPG